MASAVGQLVCFCFSDDGFERLRVIVLYLLWIDDWRTGLLVIGLLQHLSQADDLQLYTIYLDNGQPDLSELQRTTDTRNLY